MLRVDRDKLGFGECLPALTPPLRLTALASNLTARATLHDYHLQGDKVNADSKQTEARTTLLLQSQCGDGCAYQVLEMGMTFGILDRQGACSSIARQGLLLSAQLGVKVAARHLKERV